MPATGQVVAGVLAGSVALYGMKRMHDEKVKRDRLQAAEQAAADEEAEAQRLYAQRMMMEAAHAAARGGRGFSLRGFERQVEFMQLVRKRQGVHMQRQLDALAARYREAHGNDSSLAVCLPMLRRYDSEVACEMAACCLFGDWNLFSELCLPRIMDLVFSKDRLVERAGLLNTQLSAATARVITSWLARM